MRERAFLRTVLTQLSVCRRQRLCESLRRDPRGQRLKVQHPSIDTGDDLSLMIEENVKKKLEDKWPKTPVGSWKTTGFEKRTTTIFNTGCPKKRTELVTGDYSVDEQRDTEKRKLLGEPITQDNPLRGLSEFLH